MARVVNASLMRKIERHGAGSRLDVSACFNCGNCTAVCPLAEDSGGFPRRLIRMAQVGMERELLASEELWRCYACGECTQTCPRQADPAEFMAAARSYAIGRYDFTGLAALVNGSIFGNLLVFAVFSLIFELLLANRANPAGPQAALFDFLPGWWIHNIGVALFVVVGLSAVFGLVSMLARFWKERRNEGLQLRIGALPGAVAAALTDALLHRRFQQCASEQQPPDKGAERWYLRAWVVHASVMGGFLAMLLATTLDFLLKPIGSPVSPLYPMRLMGAAGGLVCLYGLTIILLRRVRAAEVPWRKSAFSDWFFPLLLAATVVTGLITEVAVYLPMGSTGHTIFFIHVVLAMDLVAMLPLTKFAHALYRTLALALFAWRRAPVAEAATAGAGS
jgi:quinone-modifying oxidoreductase, subunit QmoC